MTLHEIVTEATHTTCACGAGCDQPCHDGGAGVHLARVAHARRAGLIEAADFAQVIHDAEVFTGLTVVIDPGAGAP